ncbi:hypothetical protein [Clostridium saccharobutylicum]|uniref:Uncharacterized protein n=1 Tax=Clostridium saccharobutylicum TaxID=169679 RepID=A0A1S8MYV5_CLOSA|nr:hypothetical protein [Clostridium saccharobutylicum]OOM09343.1 hypothetical protein CLOSAC_36240 [Clostridium saccharobutylicum]
MNETKLIWVEPEIIDLSVKETKLGSHFSSTPDGAPWQDANGDWQEPHGKS